MAKSRLVDRSVPILPTSPMSLACPSCGARAEHDCETIAGVILPAVHVARVEAAASQDKRIAQEETAAGQRRDAKSMRDGAATMRRNDNQRRAQAGAKQAKSKPRE